MYRTLVESHQLTPTRENELLLAQKFLEASRALSRAIETVEELAKRNWPCVAQEEDAADTIIIDGANVTRAFRTLAMRLDRAALLNDPHGAD